MPLFLQMQNVKVRLVCLQGFSQPQYAIILQNYFKSHRDKEPGFIEQNRHKCLLSRSCLTEKSRIMFASVPHSSTSCDIPTRNFPWKFLALLRTTSLLHNILKKESPASGCQPSASSLHNSRHKWLVPHEIWLGRYVAVICPRPQCCGGIVVSLL